MTLTSYSLCFER